MIIVKDISKQYGSLLHSKISIWSSQMDYMGYLPRMVRVKQL